MIGQQPAGTLFQSKCSNCPKIWYFDFPNRMAYADSADPDQTAPVGKKS